jgi:hypothetical protein
VLIRHIRPYFFFNEAIIPLYDALRCVLDRIPKHSTTVLTNSHDCPWKPNGFSKAFGRAKESASMGDRDFYTSTTSGEPLQPGSTWPDCRFV